MSALTGRELISLWNQRRERIIAREGRRDFTIREYSDLIQKDIELEGVDIYSKKVEESINADDSNLERHTPDKLSGADAVIVDPFTSDAPAGKSSSQDNLNICLTCEG